MHIVEAKGILSAKNGMNLYRGCSHGCIYCDSRSSVYHMDHDFEDIEIKGNAIELLEAALKRKRSKCMLGTGSMTDPYIPIERKIGNVRKALELAERYGYGFSLITKVAKEKGYTNLVHFLDDGISGVTMDRPGFVEMIRQLEQGKAAAVFVKDLSRLGRNYIEVGRLTEEFFPDHDIRLVAVSDNIDTAEGENELAPIRNLFNEWYARDISKKRRISNKIKGNAGEPMGQPPYWFLIKSAPMYVNNFF